MCAASATQRLPGTKSVRQREKLGFRTITQWQRLDRSEIDCLAAELPPVRGVAPQLGGVLRSLRPAAKYTRRRRPPV